jgi:hypothetical protein
LRPELVWGLLWPRALRRLRKIKTPSNLTHSGLYTVVFDLGSF